MPQYHVGHKTLIAEIQAGLRQFPGLALAGNAYQGVGIPHCIESGQQAAAEVMETPDSPRSHGGHGVGGE